MWLIHSLPWPVYSGATPRAAPLPSPLQDLGEYLSPSSVSCR